MSIELLKYLLAVCFGGWSLYLTSERGRIVDDIKEIKYKAESAYTKAEVLGTFVTATYLTREEHKEFDNRISKSVDRLSDRIDVVLSRGIREKGK